MNELKVEMYISISMKKYLIIQLVDIVEELVRTILKLGCSSKLIMYFHATILQHDTSKKHT